MLSGEGFFLYNRYMAHLEEFAKIQKDDEKLLNLFRKSLLVYYKNFVVCLIILVLLTLTGPFLPPPLSFFSTLLVATIVVGIIFLRVWYLWSRSFFFITSLRVIAVEQKGLFSREVREAYFEDICYVSAKIKGFWQSLFKYGSVLVQTEGEMWLLDIERPEEVKEFLFKALHLQKYEGTKALPKKFWREKSE